MIASRGGVSVRDGSAFARRAASLAFAICSRKAWEELAGLEGVVGVLESTSGFDAALAWLIWLRKAAEEPDTFRVVFGVFFMRDSRPRDGVVGPALAVPGGDTACPNIPARDARGLGVREPMVLLSDKGRGLGVVWRFWARDSGCFLTVEAGRDTRDVLLGVPVGVATLALTLRLPGAVMDSLPDEVPNLLGVAGIGKAGPSLVVGLLVFDIAEAGLKGGGMVLSALKKLDLRRVLPAAGEEGSCDRLSTVRSDSEGRDFFFGDISCSTAVSSTGSCCGSSSRKPAREPALDDAREAALKPSRLPRASSSLLAFEVGVSCGDACV